MKKNKKKCCFCLERVWFVRISKYNMMAIALLYITTKIQTPYDVCILLLIIVNQLITSPSRKALQSTKLGIQSE